jgi:hypothetical protein
MTLSTTNPLATRDECHGADSLIEIRAKPPSFFIKNESEPLLHAD